MSHQKAILLAIADALNSGGDFHTAAWFTEDFRLHDPAFPGWPSGHQGAGTMLVQTRRRGPTTHIQALDMLEDGDRVAVRWQLSATQDGTVFNQAIMSMYRFENGRITEDWGISFPRQWPS